MSDRFDEFVANTFGTDPGSYGGADPGTAGWDADAFYAQTLQNDGYEVGGNLCLDGCWDAFRRCLRGATDGGMACLAQLTTCQRGCRSSQPPSSGGERLDEPVGGGATAAEGQAASAGEIGGSGGDSQGEQQSGDTPPADGARRISVTIVTHYEQTVRYWIQDLATDANNEAAQGSGTTLVDGDEHGPGEQIGLTCTETALGAAVCYRRESNPQPDGGGITDWTTVHINEGDTATMIL